MRIKDLLIPSGEIVFHGELEQLLHTIIRVNGVLMDTQRFRCSLTYPPQKAFSFSFGSVRGKIDFGFCCRYEAVDSGFRISYRVRPDFRGILLLLIPFLAAYTGGLQFAAQGASCSGLLFGLLFACIFYPIFFWKRKGCIRLFKHYFEV